MSIVDAQGKIVAEYEYDPYGNILAATGSLVNMNPLRYRGYVYDTETQFYYLQSRYYDPEIGRFLNADSYASTGQGILGNNMFAYCLNNPVIYIDSNGYLPSAQIDIYPALYGEAHILTSKNPKDSPPDHPDFKSPKKGNRKARNPNGSGYGWVDSQGNVWVWTPNMHGGPGWTVQEPDGGHSHAYPGGGTRTHSIGITEQGGLFEFPSLPQMQNPNYLSQIAPAIGIGLLMVIAFEAVSMLRNTT